MHGRFGKPSDSLTNTLERVHLTTQQSRRYPQEFVPEEWPGVCNEPCISMFLGIGLVSARKW